MLLTSDYGEMYKLVNCRTFANMQTHHVCTFLVEMYIYIKYIYITKQTATQSFGEHPLLIFINMSEDVQSKMIDVLCIFQQY